MIVTAARNPIKELLTPDPDGVTTDFQTSQPYVSGSISIWINGLRLKAVWDTGYTEVDSTTIRMKEVPLAGDSLQAQYEVYIP